MGDFGQGNMLARDGKTILNNANAFAQNGRSATLNPASSRPFVSQHPEICTMPTPVQADHLRRRLAETSLDKAAAESV
jgi:hypothetical protein